MTAVTTSSFERWILIFVMPAVAIGWPMGTMFDPSRLPSSVTDAGHAGEKQNKNASQKHMNIISNCECRKVLQQPILTFKL